MQEFQTRIDRRKKNVWRYKYFYPESFSDKEIMELETEFSPIEKYKDFFIKREDKHNSGSLKTRGISYQLSTARKSGFTKFVISTSGNAGITASEYIRKYGGELIVITSKNVPDRKIEKLQKVCKHLMIARNATHIANYIAQKYHFKNLRPSRDTNSIPGYLSLGFETYEQLQKDIDSVFIYSSSGSSFIGLYESFDKLKRLNCISKIPRMYATIRKNVINFRHRDILEICKETGGSEIIVDKEQFDTVQFETSYEGRCSLFAMNQIKPSGLSVVYLTGRKYDETIYAQHQTTQIINSLSDVDRYIKSNFKD